MNSFYQAYEQPKVFPLTVDVDVRAQSPGGNSYNQMVQLLTEGTLNAVDHLGNSVSFTSMPAGTFFPYKFRTLLATSTCTVAVSW